MEPVVRSSDDRSSDGVGVRSSVFRIQERPTIGLPSLGHVRLSDFRMQEIKILRASFPSMR
jgi:hypothetical protein